METSVVPRNLNKVDVQNQARMEHVPPIINMPRKSKQTTMSEAAYFVSNLRLPEKKLGQRLTN